MHADHDSGPVPSASERRRPSVWTMLAAIPIAVVSPVSGCVFHVGDSSLNHVSSETETLAGSGNVKKLVLSNMVGEVEIVADPSASEVTAEITKEGRGKTDELAAKALDEIEITFEPSAADPSILEARGKHPSEARNRGYSVHWKITAPPSVVLAIQTDVGEVSVNGFTSGVSVTTDVGEVRATGVAGGVKIVTNVGDVTASVTGPIDVTTDVGNAQVSIVDLTGPVNVDTDVGNVTLHLPATASASIDAETDTGNVSVGSAFKSRGKRSDNDGFRGTIGTSEGPKITLDADVGNVTITTSG